MQPVKILQSAACADIIVPYMKITAHFNIVITLAQSAEVVIMSAACADIIITAQSNTATTSKIHQQAVLAQTLAPQPQPKAKPKMNSSQARLHTCSTTKLQTELKSGIKTSTTAKRPMIIPYLTEERFITVISVIQQR